MSTQLSSGKAAALLTRLQLNPEILTEDASFAEEVISRAADWLVQECRLRRYPELSKGYAESIASPGTDITGLSTSEFIVSVNGGLASTISVTQSGNDTGAEIATAIQTAIQAESTDGWDEVTCAYSSEYTITSGRYGENSSIEIGFTESGKDLCEALGISKAYGGTEEVGSDARAEADSITVAQSEIYFRKVGVEGIKSGNVPGASSFTAYDLDPSIRSLLSGLRRTWRKGWK